MKLKRRFGRLEAIAFTTGFALMAYELTASRMMAPSIGSSTYIWTSIIGVIIAALSIGYFTGGKLADKRHMSTDVPLLCLAAAGTVALTLLTHSDLLRLATELFTDPRAQGVFAALMLFAPASFLLGVVSPYLVKLNVQSLETSGQSVASLSTLNSIGGIVGTFATGFVLFSYVGSIETLKVIVVLLVLASWLLVPRLLLLERGVVSTALLLAIFIPLGSTAQALTIDTPSAHYEIVQGYFNDRPITGLVMGPGGTQSAVYHDDSSELVFWYNREMARIALAHQPQRVLVLGGGAFTLPQYLADKLPDSQIDVVEIDPGLKPIAEKYFGYKNPSNVRLIFEDARTYVNQTDGTYDVVIVDTYGDAEMPFSLTTKEYASELARHVNEKGVVLVNVIGGTAGGACEQSLAVLNNSYSSEFAHARYSNESGDDVIRANHVVAYGRQPIMAGGLQPLPVTSNLVMTDNFAPAERLNFACLSA